MTLAYARVGKTYRIVKICGDDKARRRLIDMGFTPKCKITTEFIAPFGKTTVVGLRDFRVAIRSDAADLIEIEEA
jgi:feoA domain